MPSALRNFCCFCRDSQEMGHKPSYRRQIDHKEKRKAKSRSKQTNGRATWTRKSLLENEDMDYIDGHITDGSVAYQMKTFKSNEDKLMREHEQFLRRLENDSARKRRPVQDLFAQGPGSQPTNKTTFPWMDERFSSNGRSTTHLGISSVKISAKRNELATRGQETTDSKHIRYGKSHPLYDKVPKADTNQKPAYFSLPKPTLQNLKTNPNGKGFRCNLSIATNNHEGMIAGPVSVVISDERPVVYRETKSDVGVRRVSSNTSAYRRDPRIPKLSDLKHKPVNVSATWGTSSKGLTNKDPRTICNNFHENIYQNQVKENASDISFSSEFTLRKPNVTYANSNNSLQRKTQPNMFSTKKENQAKSKSNSKTSKHYINAPDSMYGYVPKAVQNVHASNALEGNKIDDFFLSRMHESELEQFAKVSPNNSAYGDNVVIDSITEESDVPCLEEGKKWNIYQNVKLDNKDQATSQKFTSNGDCIDIETKAPAESSVATRSDDVKPSNEDNANDCINGEKALVSDDKKDLIIMIDFPPIKHESVDENIEERPDKALVANEVKSSDSKLVDVEVLY